MFLPDESQPCTSFYNKLMGTQPLKCIFEEEQKKYKNRYRPRKPCKYNHDRPLEPPSAIIQLFKTLDSAQESIRICMYLITLKEIVKFLIHLKVTRNIHIQLITNTKWDSNSSFNPPKKELRFLSEAGIEIKTNDEGMMHNKFAIIDDKTLISGSINWTFMAFRSNNETIMFTSQPSIVEQFSQKFTQMWDRMSAYDLKPKTQMDSSPPVASDWQEHSMKGELPTKSINMIRAAKATGDSGADSDELSDLSPKSRQIVFRRHGDTDSSREDLDMSDADEEYDSDDLLDELSYEQFMHCLYPDDPKYAEPWTKPQTYIDHITKTVRIKYPPQAKSDK